MSEHVVAVVGPPPGSQGGIGSCMALLEKHYPPSPDRAIRFIDAGAVGEQRGRDMLRAAASIISLRFRGNLRLVHLNVASKGSAARKSLIALIAFCLQVPYVIHLHGAEFDKFFDRSPSVVQAVLRSFLRHSSQVICLSHSWSDALISRGLSMPSKICVVSNAAEGPDTVDYMPASPLRLLFTGRLEPRKGAEVLLQALALTKHRQYEVVIAGDGDLAPWEARAEALEVRDRVTFPGWLDRKAVQDELMRASIFVLPSEAEGQPMSLLEAMAWGLAIVSTPVGGIPELVEDGAQARLVPVNDPVALAAAIDDLVSDPSLVADLGMAARARWEEQFAAADWGRKMAAVHDFSIDVGHR